MSRYWKFVGVLTALAIVSISAAFRWSDNDAVREIAGAICSGVVLAAVVVLFEQGRDDARDEKDGARESRQFREAMHRETELAFAASVFQMMKSFRVLVSLLEDQLRGEDTDVGRSFVEMNHDLVEVRMRAEGLRDPGSVEQAVDEVERLYSEWAKHRAGPKDVVTAMEALAQLPSIRIGRLYQPD